MNTYFTKPSSDLITMKKNQSQPLDSSFALIEESAAGPGRETIFHIPPGVKFSDIYIDLQEVAMELKTCKRIITNMRKAGKLSYTTLDNGKIYYFKQEIAARLRANTVIGKNSPMNKGKG